MSYVQISKLPSDIRNQIPLSIRSFKDYYELTEFPMDLQLVIKDYIENLKDVSYQILFDCVPNISPYGDMIVIDNLYNLVSEYLRAYLLTSLNDYPFDPTFGCRLKYYLQKLDTSLQETLIFNEVSNIARILSVDLNYPVSVESIGITKSSSSGLDIEYNINILIKINRTSKSINIAVN